MNERGGDEKIWGIVGKERKAYVGKGGEVVDCNNDGVDGLHQGG
jgi:hypothetical protein